MMRYYINGWREGQRYFMSYGFAEEDLERMKQGEIITRGGNEFRIETE